MEVKPGYKQTEVGVIPEDWEALSLAQITEQVVGGGTPSKSRSDFWGGDIPWATIKDLTSFSKTSTQQNITMVGVRNSSTKVIKAGTLIVGTRMKVGLVRRFDIDVAINQDLKALFIKSEFDSTFLAFGLARCEPQFTRLAGGSTVDGISSQSLAGILLACPALVEQKQISKLLSDMDAEIEALETKLEKTKKLKQGMMSELLTGRIRLV